MLARGHGVVRRWFYHAGWVRLVVTLGVLTA
jgi:hypothetical protein